MLLMLNYSAYRNCYLRLNVCPIDNFCKDGTQFVTFIIAVYGTTVSVQGTPSNQDLYLIQDGAQWLDPVERRNYAAQTAEPEVLSWPSITIWYVPQLLIVIDRLAK
jgi:hypothetical protein